MEMLIIPIAVMLITQLIKILGEGIRGTFRWENVNNYGGMPSSHAALVTSLVFVLLYSQSAVTLPAAAVAVVLMIIVLRDATGFRRALGLHARVLNQIIKDLPNNKEYKYPILHERLGHTVAEIIVGAIIGAGLSYLALLLL